MKTFPMTCDAFHFWIPVLVGPAVALPIFATPRLPAPIALLTFGILGLVWLSLGITTLMAPRSVRFSFGELRVVRLAWPSFNLPWSGLVSVERGPNVKLLGSGVRRVAGVGGWFWSGGLFRADGVGNVRAWITRLGPTIILRRLEGLPILLGVDDVEGLLQALRERGLKVL